MTRLAPLARPQPLLGIFAIVLGWSLSHQVGSDSIFDDCSRGGPLVIVVSLIGLLVTAVSLDGLSDRFCRSMQIRGRLWQMTPRQRKASANVELEAFR